MGCRFCFPAIADYGEQASEAGRRVERAAIVAWLRGLDSSWDRLGLGKG